MTAAGTAHYRLDDLPAQRSRASGGILLQSGPFAILAAAVLYVTAHWDAVPERFPIHWDLAGRANGWGTRSIAGVFAPAMISAFVCLSMLALSRTVSRTARLPPHHPAVRISAFALLVAAVSMAVAPRR